jgi:hypothetical protein
MNKPSAFNIGSLPRKGGESRGGGYKTALISGDPLTVGRENPYPTTSRWQAIRLATEKPPTAFKQPASIRRIGFRVIVTHHLNMTRNSCLRNGLDNRIHHTPYGQFIGYPGQGGSSGTSGGLM